MGWDQYFYDICLKVAKNSKCLSRQIGSILVKDKSLISTGYNGPARGITHCDIRHHKDENLKQLLIKKGIDVSIEKLEKCPRQLLGYKSGEGLEICQAGHSERNTLINAAREGISTKNGTLYMSCGIPCTPCLIEIINAGIEEIVVTSLKHYDETSKFILNDSNLKVRLFDFLEKELEY